MKVGTSNTHRNCFFLKHIKTKDLHNNMDREMSTRIIVNLYSFEAGF